MATKSERFPKKFFNAEGLKASGPIVLEIEQERPELITNPNTGQTTEKSVLTFVDTETRLVLNSTNWDTLVFITGSSDSRDWGGFKIELYADRTPMGGKQVDCVRIRAPNSGRSAFAGKAASPPAPSANKQPALTSAASPSLSSGAWGSLKGGQDDLKGMTERPDLDDEIPF
jgi:hypothetical protein